MAATGKIAIAEAEALLERALRANAVSAENARSVARALVAAEAEGQVGHGFSRLSDYVAQAKSGKVDGHAVPRCEAPAPGTLAVDAANGFAFPALDLAIAEGIAAAKGQGTVAISIRNSHHCGALSLQVEKIARAGMVGLMMANAPAAIAPWGSHKPVFGTNPIAFAAPRDGAPPLVIDLSLSRVARGKVMHAKKSGLPIPEGWALDADGKPTTDPEAALAGSMIAIGEAKGSALALMVEVLAAVFTGANTSPGVASFFTADGPPCGAGQFLMILNPPDPIAFGARIEALLGLIEGLEGARLPGTRRLAAIAAAKADGIEVPATYLDGVREMAGLDA